MTGPRQGIVFLATTTSTRTAPQISSTQPCYHAKSLGFVIGASVATSPAHESQPGPSGDETTHACSA